MELDSNLLARLMINELPGLAGALQRAQRAPQSLAELIRQGRNQNLANAMLAVASGLLAPSPNRYPLNPLQRLGLGLGAVLGSYDASAPQGPILDVVEMEDRRRQPRIGAIARGGVGEVAAAPPARTGPSPARSSGEAEVQLTQRAVGAPRQPQAAKLTKFTGRLAKRLDHPVVLPGGWTLYGYEQDTGRPVYLGPERRLGVYG
jgi:hypothetical protein